MTERIPLRKMIRRAEATLWLYDLLPDLPDAVLMFQPQQPFSISIPNLRPELMLDDARPVLGTQQQRRSQTGAPRSRDREFDSPGRLPLMKFRLLA